MRADGSSDAPLDFQREFPKRSTGEFIFQCQRCYAPVVDSPQGRQGHYERLGHRPERKEKG